MIDQRNDLKININNKTYIAKRKKRIYTYIRDNSEYYQKIFSKKKITKKKSNKIIILILIQILLLIIIIMIIIGHLCQTT